MAGFARKFAPAPESATTANGLAPTGAGAPAAVAGLSGGGIAAVAPLPGVAAPPAVSGAVAGATLAAAVGVPPAATGAMPVVPVAVPESDVIAGAAVVAEGVFVVPVARLAGSPVVDPSLEAAEPTPVDGTRVPGLADVTDPTIEFAMTGAAGLTRACWFAGTLSVGAAMVEPAFELSTRSKPPVAGEESSTAPVIRVGAPAAEPAT